VLVVHTVGSVVQWWFRGQRWSSHGAQVRRGAEQRCRGANKEVVQRCSGAEEVQCWWCTLMVQSELEQSWCTRGEEVQWWCSGGGAVVVQQRCSGGGAEVVQM